MLTDEAAVALALRATAVLVRVGMILALLPIFGETFAPARVRALVALGLTACLVPVVPVDPAAMPTTLGGLALALLPEFLLGLAIGLTARMVFAAVQFAGQLAGEQIGFGIANVIDPSNSAQISITAQIYYLFALLLFLALDGHHVLLAALVGSFEVVPMFTVRVSDELIGFLCGEVLHMFRLAVMIAAPVVAAMLLSNLALGLIAKAVPQINIFIESFTIHIILGLFLIGATFTALGVLLATEFTRLDAGLGTVLQLLR